VSLPGSSLASALTYLTNGVNQCLAIYPVVARFFTPVRDSGCQESYYEACDGPADNGYSDNLE